MVLLRWIKQHLIVAIFGAIGVGLLIGGTFDVAWMRQLIMPLTFVLVYPMMVTLRLDSLITSYNMKLQVMTQLVNFFVFPLLAYGIGLLFFETEPYFRLGLLLIALLPTSGMTISWTVMAGGNVSAAVKMIVIGLLFGAALSPFYIGFFLGEAITVPVSNIVSQILLVVFVPLILAFGTQRILIYRYGTERFHKSIKPVFPLFSTFGVVLIIFVAIALRARVIINNPSMMLRVIPPILLLYVSFYGISYLVSRLVSREDGIALMNGTMIRNLSIALVITLGAFEEAGIAALLIAIAYVVQVQFAAWNVKLTPYIFPKKQPKIAIE
jgi:ACR3 family arsenite efflux pump ArsB